jgi:adenylyltransferase/sulfurtransferase
MKKINGFERFQRQVILKGIGEEGQLKLQDAKVLIVGAGGLGCPALQYLAAAGVGEIGIVDGDKVTASNLHRQVLYVMTDVDGMKVDVAAERIRALNPEARVNTHPLRLDQRNCLGIIRAYDIVLDCTDNFATRYMLNDACVLAGKPLVHGSVSRFEGQVGLFNVRMPDGRVSGHYRDLFPTPPMAGEVPDCAVSGVLGVLPGIIGTMQATEAIKWITGMGDLLVDRLLTYDALHNRFMELAYEHREDTRNFHPGHEKEFLDTDYELSCEVGNDGYILNSFQFDELKRRGAVQVIDVREPNEVPSLHDRGHIRIPLAQLPALMYTLNPSPMVFFCQSGIRSLAAAKMAAAHFGDKANVYSLQDGIDYFLQKH